MAFLTNVGMGLSRGAPIAGQWIQNETNRQRLADMEVQRATEDLFGRAMRDTIARAGQAQVMPMLPGSAPVVPPMPTSPYPGQPSVPMMRTPGIAPPTPQPGIAAMPPMPAPPVPQPGEQDMLPGEPPIPLRPPIVPPAAQGNAIGPTPQQGPPMAPPIPNQAPSIPMALMQPPASGQPMTAEAIMQALLRQRGNTSDRAFGRAAMSLYPQVSAERIASMQAAFRLDTMLLQAQQKQEMLDFRYNALKEASLNKDLDRQTKLEIADQMAELKKQAEENKRTIQELKDAAAQKRVETQQTGANDRTDKTTAAAQKRVETQQAGANTRTQMKIDAKTSPAISQIQTAEQKIDDALAILNKDSGVTGLQGTARRIGSSITGQLGGAGDKSADDFKQAVVDIQNLVSKELLDTRYFSGPALKRLQETIKGLSSWDSPQQTKASLEAVKEILATRREQMQSQMGSVAQPGGGTTTAAPQGAPKPGDVVDGYRFKGGDPNAQGSWEAVR